MPSHHPATAALLESLGEREPVWIFGYGSLIWRQGFRYSDKAVGRVAGLCRRFWQASADHRGTPERPGRVVTLVHDDSENCEGVAFRLPAGKHAEILAELDVREAGGYTLEARTFRRSSDGAEFKVLAYVGRPDNPQYREGESIEEILSVVRDSEGPSGHNVEYILRLAESLAALDLFDEHVFELANRLSDPDHVLEE